VIGHEKSRAGYPAAEARTVLASGTATTAPQASVTAIHASVTNSA
jgi:hypothetical protein